ncbi:MAG: hypothetical protein A2Z34_12080 [Planctomycetes bacterium RBG_16_59_8]|nr:MAG: hypothetical protein A2Z34_12080 [Planctomycetes bacterium RBG_16_59_8]
MLTLAQTGSFYEIVRRKRLTPHAKQWGSLAACAQYRLPYRKTAQYVREDFLCLDWGCGNGHFSFFLLQNGLQTHGYSFADPAAFLASENRFQHTQGLTSEPIALPYASETYDTVFSVGVLEHVHQTGGDQFRSVREIERVLKRGGLFLVYHLPNRFAWIEFLARSLNRLTKRKRHAHSRLFSARTVRDLIEGTSLEILESGRYNFIPRNMLNRFPPSLVNSPFVCRVIDAADDILSAMLPLFCQNWFFILRKRADRKW